MVNITHYERKKKSMRFMIGQEEKKSKPDPIKVKRLGNYIKRVNQTLKEKRADLAERRKAVTHKSLKGNKKGRRRMFAKVKK